MCGQCITQHVQLGVLIKNPRLWHIKPPLKAPLFVWGGSRSKTELIKWGEWKCCLGLLLLFRLSPKEEVWRVYLAGGTTSRWIKYVIFFPPVGAECFYWISTEQCWALWPGGCWALQGEQELWFLNPCDTWNKEDSFPLCSGCRTCRTPGFPRKGKVHSFQEQLWSVTMPNRSINVINYHKRSDPIPASGHLKASPGSAGCLSLRNLHPGTAGSASQLDLGILGVYPLWGCCSCGSGGVGGSPSRDRVPAELGGLHFLHVHAKIRS